MKHSERRELKDEASKNIAAICLDIISQTKVPEKIINGSALDAIEWKNNKERAIKLTEVKLNKLSLNKLKEAHEEIKALSKYVL